MKVKLIIIALMLVAGASAARIDLKDAVVATNAYMNSDELDVGELKRLVDGNKGQDFETKCIAAENTGKIAWFQFDLLKEVSVYNIKLLGRGDDKGPAQFRDFKIYVSDKTKNTGKATLCAKQEGTHDTNKGFVKYPCSKALRGRYITIESKAKYLTLCEVRLNGKIVESRDTHYDLSGARVRTGKSFARYDVGRIVDGDTSQYFDEHCASAIPKRREEISWFEIDMGDNYTVGSVELLAYMDPMGVEDLKFFQIFVAPMNLIHPDNMCADAGNSASITEFNIYPCFRPLIGRYITLMKLNAVGSNIYLSVCEIRVNKRGAKKTTNKEINLLDAVIGVGKYFNSHGLDVAKLKRIVDRNVNNEDFDKYCIAAKKDGAKGTWWQMDLMKNYKIRSVSILGRRDAKQLGNFEIYLAEEGKTTPDKLCARQEGEADNTDFVKYKCENPMKTRYVTIRKDGEGDDQYLAICELKVYGSLLLRQDTWIDLSDADVSVSKSFRNYGIQRILNGDTCQFFEMACASAQPRGDSEESYWQVDMKEVHPVGSIELLGRRDQWSDDWGVVQLQNFEIYIAPQDEIDESNLCTRVGSTTNLYMFNIYRCDRQMTGRYITIRKINAIGNDQYLSICELRVNKRGAQVDEEEPEFGEEDMCSLAQECDAKQRYSKEQQQK